MSEMERSTYSAPSSSTLTVQNLAELQIELARSDPATRAALESKAIKPQRSVRSPLTPSSYKSDYPPDHENRVIPTGVKAPYIAVWDPDSKIVWYKTIRGIESYMQVRGDTADGGDGNIQDYGTNDNPRSRTERYNVIRHDGGVSFHAVSPDMKRWRWESTPATTAFGEGCRSLAVHLVNNPSDGGSRPTIDTKKLNNSKCTFYHIKYPENETTESIGPRFIADATWPNRTNHVKRDLKRCQNGEDGWSRQ